MSNGWISHSSSRRLMWTPVWRKLMGRFTRDTGMRLYDIKYKGERVAYELGLQEAIAHYAGNDPHQSGTAYLGKYLPFHRNMF
jgi:hypothetical protein